MSGAAPGPRGERGETRRAPDGTAFELSGAEGAPVVVRVHGLGLNRACWQWTAPALADRYRVLARDL